METWNHLSDLSNKVQSSVVTIGNFDGMHLGHQAILSKLTQWKRKVSLPSIMITFHPHPSVVLGNPPPPLLTTPRQRTNLSKSFDVDHVITLEFTEELARTSAKEFIQTLIKHLNMKVLCIGPTTHIGRKREGTPQRLAQISEEMGFDLDITSQVSICGEVVSSSRIRKLIQDGRVKEAKDCLGGYFFTEGKVIHGASRGKGIGFPTANLGDIQTLVPKRGVYATWLYSEGRCYPSVTNIGVRPTVTSLGPEIVETHVLNFKENLVGKDIRLDWVERLRDEKKFSSVKELSMQIGKDIEQAKAVL